MRRGVLQGGSQQSSKLHVSRFHRRCILFLVAACLSTATFMWHPRLTAPTLYDRLSRSRTSVVVRDRRSTRGKGGRGRDLPSAFRLLLAPPFQTSRAEDTNSRRRLGGGAIRLENADPKPEQEEDGQRNSVREDNIVQTETSLRGRGHSVESVEVGGGDTWTAVDKEGKAADLMMDSEVADDLEVSAYDSNLAFLDESVSESDVEGVGSAAEARENNSQVVYRGDTEEGRAEEEQAVVELKRLAAQNLSLWQDPDSDGWAPCGADLTQQRRPPYKSEGFLLIHCNGGLNQQRSAICNAVVVAKLLNATLVLPGADTGLQTNLVWSDSSSLEDLYDVDRFIRELAGEVIIVRSLPPSARGIKPRVVALEKSVRHSPNWYIRNVLTKLRTRGAVMLKPFANRLNNMLPAPLQRLRCQANFAALGFALPIQILGQSLVNRMNVRGPWVAVHLRFEKDAVAYSMCTFGGGDAELEDLAEYRRTHWEDGLRRRSALNSTHQHQVGDCPLTPREVGLFLRALGFGPETHVYIAILKEAIYGGEASLQPLRDLFPNLVDKDMLASAEETKHVRGSASALAALDFIVCRRSTVFVSTYGGNFPNLVIGSRMHDGFHKSIRPLPLSIHEAVVAADRHGLGSDQWEDAARILRKRHHTRVGGLEPRSGSGQNFYMNPRECFCRHKGEGVQSLH